MEPLWCLAGCAEGRAERLWGKAEAFFEEFGKPCGVIDPEVLSDGLDLAVRLLELASGPLHAVVQEEIVWRALVLFTEEAAEMAVREVEIACFLLEVAGFEGSVPDSAGQSLQGVVVRSGLRGHGAVLDEQAQEGFQTQDAGRVAARIAFSHIGCEPLEDVRELRRAVDRREALVEGGHESLLHDPLRPGTPEDDPVVIPVPVVIGRPVLVGVLRVVPERRGGSGNGAGPAIDPEIHAPRQDELQVESLCIPRVNHGTAGRHNIGTQKCDVVEVAHGVIISDNMLTR